MLVYKVNMPVYKKIRLGIWVVIAQILFFGGVPFSFADNIGLTKSSVREMQAGSGRPVGRTHYQKGLASLSAAALNQAERDFKASLRNDSTRISGLLGLAEVALRRNQPQVAEEYLQDALAQAPDHAGVQTAWGRYLYSQRRFRQAVLAIKKAIGLDAKAVSPRVDLGDIYLNGLRKPKEAIEAYRAALALDPNHAGAQFAFGVAWAQSSDFSRAQIELEKAARLAPASPLPLQELGMLHATKRDYDKALESYAGALKAQPKFLPAYLGRGNVFLAQGKADSALAEYEKAIEIAPQTVLAYVRIGMLHQGSGRVAEAEKAYLAAVRLDPNQPLVYNNLAWLTAGREADLDKALSWANKAVELAPKTVSYQDTLGWVYRARGELDKAIPLLQKAAALKPQNAEILYHLGVVYAETGQAKEAAATLRKALALTDGFGGADDARRRLAELGQGPSLGWPVI